MKYVTPKLTCIGTLENLTTGGSGRSREASSVKKNINNKPRP